MKLKNIKYGNKQKKNWKYSESIWTRYYENDVREATKVGNLGHINGSLGTEREGGGRRCMSGVFVLRAGLFWLWEMYEMTCLDLFRVYVYDDMHLCVCFLLALWC
jgi:hypothetical protein